MPAWKPFKSPNTFGLPGDFAKTRMAAGGDLAAAILLYRVKYRWGATKKLERLGKRWIAMTQQQWADESGLTLQELKNRALPRLRVLPFIAVRAMCLSKGGAKSTWVSLDEELYTAHTGQVLGKLPPKKAFQAAVMSVASGSALTNLAPSLGCTAPTKVIGTFKASELSDAEPLVAKLSALEQLKHSYGANGLAIPAASDAWAKIPDYDDLP